VFIPSPTAVGSYTVTVTGTSGSISHQVNVSVTVTTPSTGDFTIDVHPDSVMLNAGTSRNVTIVVKSLGFAGPVTLTVSVSPTVTNGPTATLSLTTLTLTLNSARTTILTISTTTLTPNQDFTVTVIATSGSLSHSDSVSVSVGNLSIFSDSTSQSVEAGGSADFTLTLASDDFSGNVGLKASISPSVNNGPEVCLPISGIHLSSDGSARGSLHVCTDDDTPVGQYIITVTARHDGISHSVKLILVVTPEDEDC